MWIRFTWRVVVASQIDPTKPADGTPAVKADLRANLAAAKGEIEELQSGKAEIGHIHALADTPVSGSRALALADAANRMLRVDSTGSVTLTVPPTSSVAFPLGTVITLVRWRAEPWASARRRQRRPDRR
jgi:hypothetical protein